MGDCHCSNITIMQLFHELKQQFPALPDYIVSQCIAQNSHDKDVCAASLREAQKSTRPFFGSFSPTTATGTTNVGISLNPSDLDLPKVQQRPVSLDIRPLSVSLPPQQGQYYSHKRRFLPPLPPLIPPLDTSPSISSSTIRVQAAPSSAPPTSHSMRGFFSSTPTSRSVTSSSPITAEKKTFSDIKNNLNVSTPTSGFKLNVNVACGSAVAADNCEFITTENPFKHTTLNGEKFPGSNNISESINSPTDPYTRSYTSVSLTLRPPSSEPQPPINIRSQGSSLTYSTSSSDPRGFQSRLQISIGPTSENLGSVSAARIRPLTMNHAKQSNNLISMGTIPHNNLQKSSAGLQHESTIMNTASLHSSSTAARILPKQTNSSGNDQNFPITPSTAQSTFSLSLNTSINKEPAVSSPNKQPVIDLSLLALNQVTEHQKQLVTEQFIRKEKLAKELKIEKGKLTAMKKELETLSKPRDPLISLQELGKKLRSEIYQLRLECNLLADEVDQRSDPTVPFGETNEEFYQGIYTGQVLNLPTFTTPSSTLPPPLPSVPPALEPDRNGNHQVDNDNNRDGPSWICEMCTFDNHPLMDTCEQCDMPRFPSLEAQGETQDIHIRVTHHHNFSPRRALHSWVV